jgi:hypothetical protein
MRWLLLFLVGAAGWFAAWVGGHFLPGFLWWLGFVIVAELLDQQDRQKATQQAGESLKLAQATLREATELEAKERQRLEEEKKLQAQRERWMKMRMREKQREKGG